jgi:hypothetical protein
MALQQAREVFISNALDTTIYVRGLMAHPTATSAHMRDVRRVHGEMSCGAEAEPMEAKGQAGAERERETVEEFNPQEGRPLQGF